MRVRRCRVAPAFLAWELTSYRQLETVMRHASVIRTTVCREIPLEEIIPNDDLRAWARLQLVDLRAHSAHILPSR